MSASHITNSPFSPSMSMGNDPELFSLGSMQQSQDWAGAINAVRDEMLKKHTALSKRVTAQAKEIKELKAELAEKDEVLKRMESLKKAIQTLKTKQGTELAQVNQAVQSNFGNILAQLGALSTNTNGVFNFVQGQLAGLGDRVQNLSNTQEQNGQVLDEISQSLVNLVPPADGEGEGGDAE